MTQHLKCKKNIITVASQVNELLMNNLAEGSRAA